MRLGLTIEEFLDVFRACNEAVWPSQVQLTGLAVVAVVLLALSARGGLEEARCTGKVFIVEGSLSICSRLVELLGELDPKIEQAHAHQWEAVIKAIDKTHTGAGGDSEDLCALGYALRAE